MLSDAMLITAYSLRKHLQCLSDADLAGHCCMQLHLRVGSLIIICSACCLAVSTDAQLAYVLCMGHRHDI